LTTLQSTAQNQLRQMIEGIERLEEDKKGIQNDIRDKFLEAKGLGFDVKIMRHVLKLRKKSRSEREEEEAILDVYMHALENGYGTNSEQNVNETGTDIITNEV
jgi:uncharacterized protein (UPF0335 family)